MGSFCNAAALDECSARSPNTFCSNNLCLCKENFIQINGECKPGENAACATDTECVVDNAHCQPSDKVCKCKEGFVYAQESCLKEATEFNEECIDTEQCKPLLGDLSKCVDAKCTCEDHLQYSNGKCHQKRGLLYEIFYKKN